MKLKARTRTATTLLESLGEVSLMLYAPSAMDFFFGSYFGDDHRRSDLNETNKQFRYLKACGDEKGDDVLAIDVAT